MMAAGTAPVITCFGNKAKDKMLYAKAAQPPAEVRLGGIRAAKVDYRYPRVGSGLEGDLVPPPSGLAGMLGGEVVRI